MCPRETTPKKWLGTQEAWRDDEPVANVRQAVRVGIRRPVPRAAMRR
jgi:hypothetical protein